MQDLSRAEERDLARRCASGDPEAWREFTKRYDSFLLDQIRYQLGRPGRASTGVSPDDLLQEVYRSLLEHEAAALRRFRGNSSLKRYLAVIVSRRAADAALRLGAGPPAGVPDDPELLRALAPEESPLRSLEAREAGDRIQAALSRLSARERLALQLHYWESLPAGAMSRAFSLRPEAIRNLLFRARRRLGEILKALPIL